MILEALTRPEVHDSVLQSLHRDEEENARAGEERLLLSGISWDRYLELDEALGHNRPGPRLYYLAGELEIMTTSLLDEKLKEWIGDLVGDYIVEAGLQASPHGQATMRILKEAGAEPDRSWCIGKDKEHPDLVLEIALTSGGIDKLDVYRQFSVPEVWLWRKSNLEIWTLRRNGSAYEGPQKKSRLLPGLDVAALVRCLALESWPAARRAFRQSFGRKVRK